MNSIRCLFVALVCLVPLTSRADNPPDLKKDAELLRVPFDTILSQHMVVQVKINGKGPYRMIFDTGAPFTLLNNKVAKEAGVLPKDFRPPLIALFGQAGQFKIDKVELGQVKVGNLQTQVMDHPTVGAIAS